MTISKIQKTLIICSLFIAGVSSVFLNVIFYILPIFIILALIFTYKKIFSYKFISFCFVILIFSIFYTNFKLPQPDFLSKIAPEKLYIQGRVISVPQYLKNKTRFKMQISSIKKDNELQKINAFTLVNFYDKYKKFDDLSIGDNIELIANVRKPYPATNPGQFNYEKYLKHLNVFTVSYAGYKDLKKLRHPTKGWWYFCYELNNIRRNVLATYAKYIESPHLEILGGIVFGSEAVPPSDETKQNFRDSGLLHLLAASGMNVGLIFTIWFFIVNKFLPYRASIVSGGIIVLLYAFMTGLPPSVTRATWMLELALLGKLLDRKSDNLVLLMLVAALLLLYDPMMINDIGFQMSFIVTFGLLITMPVISEKLKSIPILASGAIFVPLIAQLWVSPVQIFHFNTFATYSVIANILVMPFIAIISFSGFIGSVLCLIPVIGEKLCFLSHLIAKPFLSLLVLCSDFFANQQNSILFFGKPSIIAILLIYSLILIAVLQLKMDFKNKKLNYALLIIFIVLLVFFFNHNFSKKLEFIFFDIGKGESILIQTPYKKNILINTGGKKNIGFSPVKTILIPYLRDIGVNKLDAIILTQAHKNYSGGIVELLEAIDTDVLYFNNDFRLSNNKATRTLKDQQFINIDKELKIQVFIPKNSYNTVILYIKYKDFSALVIPEKQSEYIKILQNKLKTTVNIIKINSEKSITPIDLNFLDVLNPQFIIKSHDKELSILEKNNIQMLKYKKSNAIKLLTNGQDVELSIFDESFGMWKKLKNSD